MHWHPGPGGQRRHPTSPSSTNFPLQIITNALLRPFFMGAADA
jgi:hypothetical protein